MELLDAVENSFENLDHFLRTTDWFGRENEVVNLYCHEFLLGTGAITPSQCGIEVAVKQLLGEDRKKLVRKDLVLWHKKNQTVWNSKQEPTNDPAVIIEWKVNSERNCQNDIEWLVEYTQKFKNVTGYSVCAYVKNNRSIVYQKIVAGKVIKIQR